MDKVIQLLQEDMNNFQWGTQLAKHFCFQTRKNKKKFNS